MRRKVPTSKSDEFLSFPRKERRKWQRRKSNKGIKRIYEACNAKEIIDAKKEHREPVIIPHFSCHVLRHTFCSRLCESDMNIKVIQEIMGHKNIETMLDIYTEVNFNKKQESLEELAAKMDFF